MELRSSSQYLAMGFRLTCQLKAYEELFDEYFLGKYEKESGNGCGQTYLIAGLMNTGAPSKRKK